MSVTFDCTGSSLSCNLHLYLALKLRRFLALLVRLESYPQMFVATWIRHVAGQADLSAPTGLLTCRASGSVTPFARMVLDRTEQAALKCVYLVVMRLDPTGKARQRSALVESMEARTPALNALAVAFPGRIINSTK